MPEAAFRGLPCSGCADVYKFTEFHLESNWLAPLDKTFALGNSNHGIEYVPKANANRPSFHRTAAMSSDASLRDKKDGGRWPTASGWLVFLWLL